MRHQEFIYYSQAIKKCALDIGINSEDISRAYNIYFDRLLDPTYGNDHRAYLQMISDTARAYRKIFTSFAYTYHTIDRNDYCNLIDDMFMDMYQEVLETV